MTNIYVSGYNNLSNYSTISSSNTLINADKIEKSFIKIYSNLYLDEKHNLYSDINGNNLIATDVTDIRPGTYLKDNKIYRVSDGFILAEQVNEYVLGDINSSTIIQYNDVNDKTVLKTYDTLTSVEPNIFLYRSIKFKSICDANRCVYLDYEGNLYYNFNYTYTSYTKIDSNVKALIPGKNLQSGGSYSFLYYITNENKINIISTGYSTTITANYISLDDDENVETFLPIENNLRPTPTYSISYYLFKTNKRVLTNNNYFKGIDPQYITHLFNNSTSTVGPFLACTTLIEYPLNIYKGDNVTIDATINTLPITETYLIVDGTTATLTITDALGNSKNVVFQIEKRKGYEFAGLSTLKNDVVPQIAIGTTPFIWEGELSLYQVYQKALPADAVVAVLYNMTCERIKIDKTRHLTQYLQLKGVFRSAVDVENPLLTLYLDAYPAFNYVYLPFFNRYYFVVGVRNISKNIYEINLKVDVLYTYKDEIKNCLAEIIRSSITEKQNPYIIDNLQPLKNTNIISAYELDNTVFNNDDETWKNNFNYVLNVIRGLNLKSTHTFDVWQ